MDGHERFVKLLENSFENKNGNRIRHLVRIVANSYSENPEKLKEYFENQDKLVVGIATSAYHFLTGDIEPIRTLEYGGLGSIINESDEGLKFNQNQLWFAKLSGNSLWNSENSGDSLKYSENNDDSLDWSKNSENSLEYSKNEGNSLTCSENSGNSLRHSKTVELLLKNLKIVEILLRNLKIVSLLWDTLKIVKIL